MTIYNPRNFLNVACVGCFFSGERVENCSYRYRFDLIDCADWFLDTTAPLACDNYFLDICMDNPKASAYK